MLQSEHVQYVLDELATFDKARTESGLQVRAKIPQRFLSRVSV